MKLQQLLKEIDSAIQTAKEKKALTPEEMEFFGQLKKRTEEVDQFFKRMQKNVGIAKKR